MKKLIIFLCLMALISGTGQWEEITAIAAIVLAIYLFITLLIYIVVELEFTVLPKNEDELILLHYKGNRVEIGDEIALGKPMVSIIKLPYVWIKKIVGGEVKLIESELEIEMNDLTIYSFPIIMKCRLLREFSIVDLQKKLGITVPRRSKIRKNRQRKYSALNMLKPIPRNPEMLRMDIIRFNNGRISFAELTEIIKTNVDYPWKFFSNLKKIDLEISQPNIIVKFKK